VSRFDAPPAFATWCKAGETKWTFWAAAAKRLPTAPLAHHLFATFSILLHTRASAPRMNGGYLSLPFQNPAA